jgi:hypothetical protein
MVIHPVTILTSAPSGTDAVLSRLMARGNSDGGRFNSTAAMVCSPMHSVQYGLIHNDRSRVVAGEVQAAQGGGEPAIPRGVRRPASQVWTIG